MIASVIATWGYPAVFLGTLLEGETILLAAGFAAHQGLLDWRLVAAFAFCGATLGDQLAYWVGVRWGDAVFGRFPALAGRIGQAKAQLHRHQNLFILSVRFLYGLRIAGPLFMGMAGVAARRFAVLNLLGAALWTMVVGGAGFVLGAAIESLLPEIQRVEELATLAILIGGGLVWIWRRRR